MADFLEGCPAAGPCPSSPSVPPYHLPVPSSQQTACLSGVVPLFSALSRNARGHSDLLILPRVFPDSGPHSLAHRFRSSLPKSSTVVPPPVWRSRRRPVALSKYKRRP